MNEDECKQLIRSVAQKLSAELEPKEIQTIWDAIQAQGLAIEEQAVTAAVKEILEQRERDYWRTVW